MSHEINKQLSEQFTEEKLIVLIEKLLDTNNNDDNFLFSNYEITTDDIKFTNKTNKTKTYFESDDMKSFINLLDNYKSDMDSPDNYTSKETEEINNFLNKLSNKDFFKHICREISTDTDTFRKFIRSTFFDLISVGNHNKFKNTCAFEHIFVGEFKYHEEKGFHNWVQLYLKKSHNKITLHPNNQIQLGKLSVVEFGMNYNKQTKHHCSMILGIHPMIEICIYALIYKWALTNNLQRLYHPQELEILLNKNIGYKLGTVVCDYDNNISLRTCYPFIKKSCTLLKLNGPKGEIPDYTVYD
jgi:hypothetical protein